MIIFEPLSDLRLTLGESPVWDDRRGCVFLCDIDAGRLLAMNLDGRLAGEWSLGAAVCSLGLGDSGSLVVALAREIIAFDPDTGNRQTLAQLVDEPDGNRFNDGKIGPDGAFWVGTMAPQRQPTAALYRIDATGRLVRRKAGLRISNGLAWSPEGSRLYHSDSAGCWIEAHAFDPETGEIGPANRLAEPGEAQGRPDGAATDAEGFYWSAGVSAGCLNRFAPDGRLVATYTTPLAAPTMPCFCGPGLETLLLTSHRRLPANRLTANPFNGAVLVGRAPVAGAPVSRMKGL